MIIHEKIQEAPYGLSIPIRAYLDFSEDEVNDLTKQIIKKYQRIDCLINSAAYTMNNKLKKNNIFERFEKYDFELWKQSLEGHLSGTFVVTKSVAKYMLKMCAVTDVF